MHVVLASAFFAVQCSSWWRGWNVRGSNMAAFVTVVPRVTGRGRCALAMTLAGFARELFDRSIGKSQQHIDVEVSGRHRYDQMDALELIAWCEELDARREAEGLAPRWVDDLPAALKELRQKRIDAEAAASGGESSN